MVNVADDDEKNAVSVNSLLVQVYVCIYTRILAVNVGFCCDVPCDVRLFKVNQMYAFKGKTQRCAGIVNIY